MEEYDYQTYERVDGEKLPDLPDLSEFNKYYRSIDVGYDCFCDVVYVYGPYIIQHEEESYRNDLHGWNAYLIYEEADPDNPGKKRTMERFLATKEFTLRQAFENMKKALV